MAAAKISQSHSTVVKFRNCVNRFLANINRVVNSAAKTTRSQVSVHSSNPSTLILSDTGNVLQNNTVINDKINPIFHVF